MSKTWSILCLCTLILVSTAYPLSNFCQAPGQISLSSAAPSDEFIFDHVGSYLNQDFQSTTLLVINAELQNNNFNNYTIAEMNNDGSASSARQCPGSHGDTFHALINQFLILNGTDGYYACRYHSTQAIVRIQLDTTSHDCQSFVPYLADGNNLYVACSSPTDFTKVLTYVYSNTVGSQAYTLTASQATTIQIGQQGISGTDQLLFNLADKKFYGYASNAWTQINSAPASLFALTLTNFNFKFYPLIDKNVIIALTDTTNAYTGYLYLGSDNSISETGASGTLTVAGSTASNSAIIDYSDGFYNFVRVSSKQIQWITYSKPSSGSASFYKSVLTPQNTDGYSTIALVSTSQNKLSIFDKQGLTVYRHDADGIFTFILYEKLASALTVDGAADVQHSLSFECVRRAISKMTCFSQTLKCVILYKAQQAAGPLGTDSYTNW